MERGAERRTHDGAASIGPVSASTATSAYHHRDGCGVGLGAAHRVVTWSDSRPRIT